MSDVFHERRLSDRLKRALDDIEGRSGSDEIAKRLRQTYKLALESEARYRPNRRAATRDSDTE